MNTKIYPLVMGSNLTRFSERGLPERNEDEVLFILVNGSWIPMRKDCIGKSLEDFKYQIPLTPDWDGFEELREKYLAIRKLEQT